jgi:predicted NUDIX family NTP pyrophosphohydrolase
MPLSSREFEALRDDLFTTAFNHAASDKKAFEALVEAGVFSVEEARAFVRKGNESFSAHLRTSLRFAMAGKNGCRQ